MKKTVWLILSVVSFVLCGMVYFFSHSDIVNIAKADYYFKQNNIETAIKFYEQAFDSGALNKKARDNYVNLIINSPMDADAQERLVKFIKYPQNDEAREKANMFLTELRYEIHKKYPDNYVSQCTYNQKIIRWAENVITYSYTNPEEAPEYFIEEIDKAFEAWEKSLEGAVKFKKVEADSQIVICFNTSETLANENEKYIAAVTKPIINSNILKNIVTNYYLKTPNGENFSQNQIYNIALHEIGHDLGFWGHSDYPKNIMYMSTDMVTVTNDLRKILTLSDINTIKLLYKIKPDISDNKQNKGEYTKYLILGNDIAVANAKIKEAKNYIQKAPNLPSGYIDLADGYVATEEYPKALKSLDKALMLAKDEDTVYSIYYNMALVYFYMSDYEKALNYLEKSGNLKNTETSLYLLARIYTLSGSKNEAINIYESLISKNPSNMEYVIGLANIYVKSLSYLKARSVLREFLLKNPNERNNPRLNPYGIIKIGL